MKLESLAVASRSRCDTTRREHHCIRKPGHKGCCMCSHGYTLKNSPVQERLWWDAA